MFQVTVYMLVYTIAFFSASFKAVAVKYEFESGAGTHKTSYFGVTTLEIVHKGGSTRDTDGNTRQNWLGRIEFDDRSENAVFLNMNLHLVLENKKPNLNDLGRSVLPLWKLFTKVVAREIQVVTPAKSDGISKTLMN